MLSLSLSLSLSLARAAYNYPILYNKKKTF